MTESPLVSCEWLASHLDDPGLALVDATFFLPNQGRNARQEYSGKHIRGAAFFDVDDIADHSSELPHMLPSAADFARSVGMLGIGNDSLVIAYDQNDFLASARVWWTFRAFGFDRVRVLDGGLARWNELDLPTVSGPGKTQPKTFIAPYGTPGLVRNLDEVRLLTKDNSVQLIDARSPGRFSGSEPEPRQGLRSGHIPGSQNVFFKNLIDPESHCLKPVNELATEFANAGIAIDGSVVATCGTGVSAAVLALGLYCLGNRTVAVYDGSWTEWGARADTPVATGQAT